MKQVNFVFVVILFNPCVGYAAVEPVVESFNGDGLFDSTNGTISGLDNPGWGVFGNGTLDGGGYSFTNSAGLEESESDVLVRTIEGQGSFVSTMEIRNLDLGDVDENSPPDAAGVVKLHQLVGSPSEFEFVGFALWEVPSTPDGLWALTVRAGENRTGGFVPRGDHILFEVASVGTALAFSYDNDINDEVPSLEFELDYGAPVNPFKTEIIFAGGSVDGRANGILDSYTLISIPDIQGDFNGNDTLDVDDIDVLTTEVQAGTNDTFFDLNNDSLVDALDRTIWVHDLANTFFGDANLNAEFNSADLVNVFQAAEYEDNVPLNSTWLTGDWNGDGDFSSADLVLAFQDGGYKTGPRAATTAVPEPTWLLILFSALPACRRQVGVRFGSPC